MFPATDYYMDFCLEKESIYNKMRVDIPLYFKDAETFINEMES